MKKILLFIAVIITLYSCSSDNNVTGPYPSQPITVYQSRLFDTLRVYTSVNDSLYLGNFDFNGYDSMRIELSFSITSNSGAVPYIDFSLPSGSNENILIRQILSGGGFNFDGKFGALPSGEYYFRNRSTNQYTGFYLIIVSNFRITKF